MVPEVIHPPPDPPPHVYNDGKAAAYKSDDKLDGVIDGLVPLVSSVAFGGPEFDRLYVTTIAHDVNQGHAAGDGGDHEAGCLFAIDVWACAALPSG